MESALGGSLAAARVNGAEDAARADPGYDSVAGATRLGHPDVGGGNSAPTLDELAIESWTALTGSSEVPGIGGEEVSHARAAAVNADGVVFPGNTTAQAGGEGPQRIAQAGQVAGWAEETDYSEKYVDEVYEYRRVTVPRAMLTVLPVGRCMEESEWRACGIIMSRGWEHYDHHFPEANVLLFRRVLGTDPKTGWVPPAMRDKVARRKEHIQQLEQERQRRLLERARQQEQPAMDLL